MSEIKIDPTLVQCAMIGTIEGLGMTNVRPDPVGSSRLPGATRELSVLISLHGKRSSGSLVLNMPARVAMLLAGRFVGDTVSELTDDCLDAVCELGNHVAGRCKDRLHGTPYEFGSISLPALVFGGNYNVYHYRGIRTATVEFEVTEIPLAHLRERFFSTSISVLDR